MQPLESMHRTSHRLWSGILTLMEPFRFPVRSDTWSSWVWGGSRSSGHCGMCRWGRSCREG